MDIARNLSSSVGTCHIQDNALLKIKQWISLRTDTWLPIKKTGRSKSTLANIVSGKKVIYKQEAT